VDVIVTETLSPDPARSTEWGYNALLSVRGFRLEFQFVVDAVFVRRGIASPERLLLPRSWEDDWEREVHNRCSAGGERGEGVADAEERRLNEELRCGGFNASFAALLPRQAQSEEA
jgi:hypothetical protein